jgi:hypothetical protein
VHLKKCFEGIKKLEMVAPKEGRKAYETTGIFSPDGEYLALTAAVVLDARPEEWLNWVTTSILKQSPLICEKYAHIKNSPLFFFRNFLFNVV